jgi:beta-1,4-galactosyltransferase 1
MEELEAKFSNDFVMHSGGHWQPLDCVSHSKVAIIIPFRNREKHLHLFLNHMHSFLKKQLLDYAIYIIEEVNYNDF